MILFLVLELGLTIKPRSDLGYTRPPAPHPPPMMSPKKPPRMYQYSNINNSALGNRRSVAENKQSVNVPISMGQIYLFT